MHENIVVSGAFDDMHSCDLRFLQEAALLGKLTVLLHSDEAIQRLTGKVPKFPLAERMYLLNAVRYVSEVIPFDPKNPDELPWNLHAHSWADIEGEQNTSRAKIAQDHGLSYKVIANSALAGFPLEAQRASSSGTKKVIVTGCYDYFHSGHARFFEEVSAHGDLYVVVGHDANIRALKGHDPLFPEDERRYVVGSIRYVHEALISTGNGWLDADPEIRRTKPDIYAVNEDGDKGGKREYCQQMGLEYLVLKRTPAQGLTARSSTNLKAALGCEEVNNLSHS